MKKMKRILPLILAVVLTCTSLPLVAKADTSKVVTLGANLSEEQKASMYEYFGTSAGEVDTIIVTNEDERKYMEGIATEEQIGHRTFSCSYVEPTSSGGIQVKVANLTFVTSSMIASTLLTSGVENCNVVAASPIEVSGTGALTGIMMAYEAASGETLDEGQKEAATEELVTTGELAESIGHETATDLMNDVKQEVIENDLTNTDEIQEVISNTADTYNITLTEDQIAKIVSLMQTIAQYDYDVNALKDTLDNLEGKTGGFFSNIWNSIKNFFTGDSGDGGIINDTKDELLGDNAVIDSTLDALTSGSGESIWTRIVNFFKGLFGDDEDADSDNQMDTTGKDGQSQDTGPSESTPADTDSTDTDTNDADNTDTSGSTGSPQTDDDSATDENTDTSETDETSGENMGELVIETD